MANKVIKRPPEVSLSIQQLYHHGIKDMKWGVRRFQNEDGTRTAAGKRRDRENGRSEDYEKSRKDKSKGTKSLSNDELKKLNERLRLEEDYKKLTAQKIEKSESWVKRALEKGGEAALTDFSKGVFLGGAKLLVKELSPQFAEVAFAMKVDKPQQSVITSAVKSAAKAATKAAVKPETKK
jgi:hypothetical protein